MYNKTHVSDFIKQKSYEKGFAACGISKIKKLDDQTDRYKKWIKENNHGTMNYLEKYINVRINPALLLNNAKSIISLLFNYYTNNNYNSEIKISKYAYGYDYHIVVKDKLHALAVEIKNLVGDINYRVFADSAPILERYWAVNSGLGWIGKNGLLINKNLGSFHFLCEIIIDIELEYDKPVENSHCGNCTKCIDACPTKALNKNNTFDAKRCISYLTIESKEDINNEFKGKIKGWAFGCDICQDVCPWNKKAVPNNEPLFNNNADWTLWSKKDWLTLQKNDFDKTFKNSPVKRAGYEKILNTIKFNEL